MLRRRRPLERRVRLPRVALSRNRRRERTTSTERELRAAFKWSTCNAGGWACVMDGRGPCGGPLEAHHVTTKEAIKRYARSKRLDRRSTVALLWDPSNGLAICDRHHDRHTTAHQRIPLALVPAGALTFARTLGLDYLLDRTYDTTTEGDRP